MSEERVLEELMAEIARRYKPHQWNALVQLLLYVLDRTTCGRGYCAFTHECKKWALTIECSEDGC